MPRSTGASQRVRPSYTATRYSPSGLATVSTAALKRRIWSHPLRVISELLGPQERVDQIEQHDRGHDQRDDRFGAHGRGSPEGEVSSARSPSRAQPATYASIRAKK